MKILTLCMMLMMAILLDGCGNTKSENSTAYNLDASNLSSDLGSTPTFPNDLKDI